MIEDKWRYFAPSGAITPGGPSTWNILDWDQRHIIAVTMDEEQESEDVAVGYLRKHIDTLGPDVYGIHLSQDGELVSVSTNSEDDQGTYVYYPPLQAFQQPSHVKTVLRSHLVELNRFGPNVDLVSYTPCASVMETRKAVFKYYFLLQFIHKRWDELNLWMRLPRHPNLVPFDRLVLDEVNGNVVGFTSLYIPGGTIEENKSRTFKLKWLQQLICVIDDLNLKYGIAHQDVAERNLLVDLETDALMLFDFNYSGRIGDIGYYGEDHNDVKGVIFTMYEIITRDTHFRDVAHDQQNLADVQGLEEWAKHPDVNLDHPVSAYRSLLNDWVNKRRNGKQIALYTEAPEYISWPEFPTPPPEDIGFPDGKGNTTVITSVVLSRRRHRDQGKNVTLINWERPAQIKLGKDDRVLANGQLATTANCTGSINQAIS